MNKLLLTLGTVLLISGCGYADKNECMLKEQQKCEGNCFITANKYCSAKFPTSSEKAKIKELRKKYDSYAECTKGQLAGQNPSIYKQAQVRNICNLAFNK
tara:strand:+ start:273 stop:572 length:300 start_codon:yes stop_codon:yes gene_type:complete